MFETVSGAEVWGSAVQVSLNRCVICDQQTLQGLYHDNIVQLLLCSHQSHASLHGQAAFSINKVDMAFAEKHMCQILANTSSRLSSTLSRLVAQVSIMWGR